MQSLRRLRRFSSSADPRAAVFQALKDLRHPATAHVKQVLRTAIPSSVTSEKHYGQAVRAFGDLKLLDAIMEPLTLLIERRSWPTVFLLNDIVKAYADNKSWGRAAQTLMSFNEFGCQPHKSTVLILSRVIQQGTVAATLSAAKTDNDCTAPNGYEIMFWKVCLKLLEEPTDADLAPAFGELVARLVLAQDARSTNALRIFLHRIASYVLLTALCCLFVCFFGRGVVAIRANTNTADACPLDLARLPSHQTSRTLTAAINRIAEVGREFSGVLRTTETTERSTLLISALRQSEARGELSVAQCKAVLEMIVVLEHPAHIRQIQPDLIRHADPTARTQYTRVLERHAGSPHYAPAVFALLRPLISIGVRPSEAAMDRLAPTLTAQWSAAFPTRCPDCLLHSEAQDRHRMPGLHNAVSFCPALTPARPASVMSMFNTPQSERGERQGTHDAHSARARHGSGANAGANAGTSSGKGDQSAQNRSSSPAVSLIHVSNNPARIVQLLEQADLDVQPVTVQHMLQACLDVPCVSEAWAVWRFARSRNIVCPHAQVRQLFVLCVASHRYLAAWDLYCHLHAPIKPGPLPGIADLRQLADIYSKPQSTSQAVHHKHGR